MLKIHSIETFGTQEGPGIRYTIFTQGCMFRCLYCHNPDTIEIGIGKEVNYETLLPAIIKQKLYFNNKGGVTISGGEPLLQAKELIPLFKQLKNQNIHTAIDTNGNFLNDYVKELLNYTDLVLLCVKHVNNERHRKISGSDNFNVIKTIEYLESIGKPVWLRYVLVPGRTDQPEYLTEFAQSYGGMKNIERVEILPYHNLGVHKYKEMGREYKLKGVIPPTKDQIQIASDIFRKSFKNVIIK